MNVKKIKFSNTIETDFVNKLRGRVKEYFEKNGISKFGNTTMRIKTIFMFLLFFAPYLAMITGLITSPGLIIMCWILMGFGMAGIGLSVMHDANHRSYSGKTYVNRILSYTLNLLGGFYPNWQYQHNTMHHSYTNVEGFDEDIDPGSVLRFSPNSPLRKHHRYQHLYAWFLYGLMTLTWSLDKDFKQLSRYLNEGIVLNYRMSKRRLITELVISKLIFYGYLLVIPLIFLPVPWWSVILLYLLMHFISGFTLSVIFQTAHVMPELDYPLPDEAGNIENNWAIHQMITTSNYAPRSRFFSWFIGGLNFQVEHHLFPNICHVHYKDIAPIVQRTAAEFNVPYHVQPTFFHALKSHYRMLMKLGRDER